MLRVWHCLGLPFLMVLAACSTTEPLVTASIARSEGVPQTDQAVIAETVGRSEASIQPLAWANPSTGSAGVIQQVGPVANGDLACKQFVSTHQTISGSSSFNGIACPSDGKHWKINR